MLGIVVAVVSGPRFAPRLPPPLRRIAASFPTIASLRLLGVGALLSLVTQLCGVVAGHALITSITPGPTFLGSLQVVPLIDALQYFPLSIGGTGVHAAACVRLLPIVGVAPADALATSLLIDSTQWVVNGFGSILHALRRVDPIDGQEPDP